MSWRMGLAMAALFASLLCVSGCDDRTLVIIAVGPIPANSLKLRASLTYNGSPSRTPEDIEFDLNTQLPGSTATFGVKLSPDMNGELIVAVGVLDTSRCLTHLGSGSTRMARNMPHVDIALAPPMDVARPDLCNGDVRTPLLLQAVPSLIKSTGERVRLLGWDFACDGPPQVSVGGKAGENLSCRSLSELEVDVPANSGPVGLVPITVINKSGKRSTRGDLLAYYASQLSFDKMAKIFSVGAAPSDLAIGRIDGDNLPDLAVTSRDDGKLTVRVNDGHGDFRDDRRTILSVGARPSGVAIGDLNQDKRADLVVVNAADNTVSLLLQEAPAVPLAFKAGTPALASLSPTAIRLMDLNGDGVLEAIVLNRVASDVTVMKRDDNGRYVRVQDYTVGRDPVQLAIGDLNADGTSDLAVISAGEGTISLLIADRTGGFIGPASFNMTGTLSSVAMGDVDGDGDLDVVTGGTTIGVLRNDGGGQFAPAAVAPSGLSGQMGGLALADLDFDGYPDLAVAMPQENRVYVLRNLARDGQLGFTMVGGGYSVGARPTALGVADFDGDGLIDIAVANQGESSVSILFNRST